MLESFWHNTGLPLGMVKVGEVYRRREAWQISKDTYGVRQDTHKGYLLRHLGHPENRVHQDGRPGRWRAIRTVGDQELPGHLGMAVPPWRDEVGLGHYGSPSKKL